MSPKPINLSKAIIYKIFSVDPKISECYIGHTTRIVKRRAHHKAACMKHKKESTLYNFIRANGGFDNFRCVKILDCPATSREEILEAEERIINSGSYNTCLNLKM